MDTESIIFSIGPLAITRPVVTTWAVMLGLTLLCALATRRLTLDPGRLQTMLEGVVSTIHAAIEDTLPGYGERLLPFIGSLWIFIAIANLVGVLPGAASPTGDLSTTAALAIVVFLSVHWFGIRSEGLGAYLRHYMQPSPIMIPFHIISEISRTVALAVRLFGNVMSLETAAILVLLVAGFLVPVPVLLLHIVEALVQAYIFGMLALVYISGGIQSRQNRSSRNEAGASS
ncbi:MAG: F0F1 ATP synthase subunit A [Zoogloeaceae bacterium]|nr:F0F1 ATP synthase subunit A [Rhodocyclaceae bacterium]MCP5234101.1 F0F1 ATP synthase subunit A [Zoogloeaceae bacterium]MCP5241074.1 F0F1 ATP synthase subunit A [Zoogloeaceae bacterium]MCP5256149.1 F0F1 ATP synthase subunit A [Zoogloeaceae bacterium]MCW5617450.1 F0F1 ATP synthase subunit A [Rhodocyclaceae bacterium]